MFEIELEFAVADGKQKRSPNADECIPEESLEGRHFLLVEDNAINSEILAELLQMWGATCVLRENGLQAVEEFESSVPGTYDAILMDIQMPVMNGYEATRKIRSSSHPEAKTMVILAMTANAFREDAEKCMEAGMNAHLAKPLDAEKMIVALKQCMADNRDIKLHEDL